MAVTDLGFPRVDFRFKESTSQAGLPILSRICVLGPTKMGIPYTPVAIDSWEMFVTYFGGLQEGNPFPLYCKRALAAGAKLYVARAAHDAGGGVWEGVYATATITQSPNSITFTAKSVGEGYNGITVQIRAAKSRAAGKVDVVETYGTRATTAYDINLSPTAEDADKLNRTLKYTSVSVLPSTLPIGTGTLASGAQTLASIVDGDYIGDMATPTKGLHTFDEVFDSIRIANLTRHNATVDAAYIAYCEARQNMRAILFVPDDLAGEATDMVDYRNAGNYDSMYATLYAGRLTVADSTSATGTAVISIAGDVVGAISKKDFLAGVPASVSGNQYGVLLDNLGVPYNLALPVLLDDANFVTNNGVIPIVRTMLPNEGGVQISKTVIWGNNSLHLDAASQLRKDNICDLLVYMRYLLYPIFKSFLFKPNDIKTWYELYGKVKPVIMELANRQFIRAGEGANWQWNGDQNARSLNNLTINTKADVDNGLYRAQLVVVPMTLMEYINIEIVHTDSATVVTIINQNQ